jgi:CRISPR/Cas system-associated exonuclease Cas4 (RecB family)
MEVELNQNHYSIYAINVKRSLPMINYSKVRSYKKKQAEKFSSKGKIYISVLSKLGCERQLKFMFDGIGKDKDFFVWDGLENDIGNAIHETLQKIFMETGELVAVEIPIKLPIDDTFYLSMRIDGELPDGSLWELKTLGEKDGKIQEPKIDHVTQLNFYLGVTNKAVGFLDYVKRDNGKLLKQFKINFDPELFEQTLNKVLNVQMMETQDLAINKKDCNFCQYKSECKKLDKSKQE